MTAVAFEWTTVLVIGLALFAVLFLAVLWSRREWRSRKIRVGVFLERYYGHETPPDDDEAPTGEWPRREP